MVSMWEGLLSATGGDLRADKCYWYMIDFKYRAGRWLYKSKSEMPGELTVQDNYTIKRLDPWEAEENLGVHLTMTGNWDRQAEKLQEKAEEFGGKILRGEIEQKDAWYTFSKAFMPSLRYCMPATSMTLEQWESILGPALGLALSKLGIVSKASRKLVFTQHELQGLGEYHPYFHQYIEHLGISVTETRNFSPTGKSISALAEETRRQAGVFGSLAEIPRVALVWLVTESWLRSLLLFANQYHIDLVDDGPQILPKRQNDEALISRFITQGVSGFQLKQLKDCCDYIGAQTVADVAMFDGKMLQTSLFSIKIASRRVCANRTEPRQVPIKLLNWQLFVQSLKKFTSLMELIYVPVLVWT